MESLKENIFWDRMAERTKETISALLEERQPKVIRYAVHATSGCNMRCIYCRESKTNPKMINRKLFREICENAGEKGIVHITGGEPTLIPWLEDEINNYHDKTRFALNTNLLLLPSDKCLSQIFRLKTSLDDYDATRWNSVTGGNFFSAVVTHIKMATEAVKYTSICFTATHQNSYRLHEFILFCKAVFPRLYSLSVSFYKGNDPQFKLTSADISTLFLASSFMDDISRKIFSDTHSLQGNYYPKNLEVPCYLSLTERLFDEWGNEYYCSHLYRDKVAPPGNPGADPHCVTGCNAKFNKYNTLIHEALNREKGE